MVQTTGEGPMCPVSPLHGRTMIHQDWEGRYYCPVPAHGGNGRFFTEAEVFGEYTLTEEDIMKSYETAARKVLAETLTMDAAVKSIATQTKEATSKVRERLSTMVDALRSETSERAETRAAVAATKTARRASTKAAPRRRRKASETKVDDGDPAQAEKPTRRRASSAKTAKATKATTSKTAKAEPAARTPKSQQKGWVDAPKFAAVRDKHGVRNSEIAVMMGLSPSRMTEFTRGTAKTQGGSKEQFEAFTAACRRLAGDA